MMIDARECGRRTANWLARWVILAVSVWVATAIVDGMRVDDQKSLLIAAVILGVLNTMVKPVLVTLALPAVVASLGLAIVLINGFLLVLTDALVPGFHVDGFLSAVGGALIISIVSIVLSVNGRLVLRRVARDGTERRSKCHDARPTRSPPPGVGPVIDV